MLQNARVTVFTISELLRENQQGGLKLPPPPNQNRVKATDKNKNSVELIISYSKSEVVKAHTICKYVKKASRWD